MIYFCHFEVFQFAVLTLTTEGSNYRNIIHQLCMLFSQLPIIQQKNTNLNIIFHFVAETGLKRMFILL